MGSIFLTLLNRSISAGWLILAVMALRLVLKGVPRRTVCLLWSAAAVRLACPVGVESVFSLIPSAQTLRPEAVQYAARPAIESGIAAVDVAVNPVLGAVFAAPPQDGAAPLQVWISAAGVVWALGLGLMLGWALLGYARLRLRVREAAWVRGAVWACDQVSSPFILGIVRPRIYLPSGMPGEQARYVLAHENAHLRRRDHWWKPMGYLLLSVYWFHPLVWAGYVLFCRDIELACDEAVAKGLDFQERKNYSRALLECSVRGGIGTACPLAFGEAGVKARVRAVLRYRKPALWAVLAGAAACAVVAVCFLTDPVSKAEEPEDGPDRQEAPEPYSYEGTVFTYGDTAYEMTDMHPSVNAILDCAAAGDLIVVDCHIGPNVGYYGIFDTASRTFLPGITGSHLVWRGDDLSTGVYEYAGRLFRYGGALLANLDLGEGDYVYGMALQEDGSAVTAAIVNNEAQRTVTVPLAASRPAGAPYAAYNDLIALATEALETHTRPEGQEADPFSYLFYMKDAQDYQTLGWLLLDLDGDGTEELLFGENGGDGWDGILFDIYTLSGGEAVHLFSGWERSRYYLCENGAIAHEGSGGAFTGSRAYYSYQNGEARMIEALRYTVGADDARQNYYTTDPQALDSEDGWTAISQAQADAIEAKYVYVLPRFTPFTALYG